MELHAEHKSKWEQKDGAFESPDGVHYGLSVYSSLVLRAAYHRELAWFGQDRPYAHTYARTQPRATSTRTRNAYPPKRTCTTSPVLMLVANEDS